jgi:high affinity Mn2+ porin
MESLFARSFLDLYQIDSSDDERDRCNVCAGNIHLMNRGNRSWERAVAGVGLGLLAFDGQAFAADLPASLPVKAPVPYVSTAYDWNGWYVGAHAGVIRGSSNWSAIQPGAGGPALNRSFDLPFNFDFMAGTGSYVAGIQGGYNYVFPSRLMLGVRRQLSEF